MEHDLHSQVTIANVIPPAALVADTVGTTLDTLGYESCEFVLHVGTAMVGGGFDALLEESAASGGVYTAVPAANRIGSLPTVAIGDANKVFRVGTIGKMRWQRLTIIETGTITGGVIGATAILSKPRTTPTAAQFT